LVNSIMVADDQGTAAGFSPPTAGVFEGVCILSLAEQLPGPFATMLLADLGADVILVERPGGGDPARAIPPVFGAMARNKRSICIDLKADDGKRHFEALARTADVVVEGFRPGVMDRLGLGYTALASLNPGLVYASISGFGQSGPYRDRTAHDLSCQGVAGHLFDHGACGVPAVPYGDLAGAMFAAFAIASALFARERTGNGTSIDISMADGLASWMTPFLGPALNGFAPFDLRAEPAYGLFACLGGSVLSLSIAHEDHFWQALCRLLDLPDAAGLRARHRVARSAELRLRIAAVLAGETLAAWAPRLDAAAIPWSPVHDIAGVATDAHFLQRGLFSRQPEEDGTWFVCQPVKFSRYSSSLRRGAPALGEHTRQVLGAGTAAACSELDGDVPQHLSTDPSTGSTRKK